MITIDDDIISNALKHYIYLHRHPEVSFQERSTCAYICNVLNQSHISYEIIGETGIIGLLQGQNPSRTIALRADIDALPIQENPEHSVVSSHPGIMHACGHDLHTACLLGTIEYLNRQKAILPVNVMFIFQHAEEVLPGGAKDILESNFFKTHWPEWIIAQHAEPDLPVGSVGICPGQYMASGDEIYITLHGPGGHAALPDKSVDLILIASHIIIALQQITSRQASPLIPTVLTFGNIRCQSAMNIIPGEIILEGTFRTFNEKWRKEAKEHIQQITTAIAKSMGAQVKINIITGYPSLFNNPEKTEFAVKILQSLFGENQVLQLSKRMTTEDFARYSQVIPATFIRLGVKGQSPCGKLHTSEFCPDLAALQYGIINFSALILPSLFTISNSKS